MVSADIALNFVLGRQGRDRVNDNHINFPRANQRFGNFQGLLAVIRLGDEQFLSFNADFLRVIGVQRVFGVNEGAGAAELLGLGDHVESQGGFARRLGAEDFRNPAAGQTTDAERQIQTDGAGGNGADIDLGFVAQLHNRSLAELGFNGLNRFADTQNAAVLAGRFFCRHNPDLKIN